MNSETFIGMISNMAFLLALAVIYEALPTQVNPRHRRAWEVFTGVLIGMIGIVVMMIPWRFSEGVVFDTRSILLSLAAFFFGLIPAVLASLMTVAFRLYQGGSGTTMGVLVILTSAGLGLIWRHFFKNKRIPTWYELYGFGLTVHVAMLLCTFALPNDIRSVVFDVIWRPVLVVYPVGTVLLGLLLAHRSQRNQLEVALRQERDLLARISESSLDAILVTGSDGSIFAANPAACRMFGRSEQEIFEIGRNGIVDLSDPRLPLAMEERNRTGHFVGELNLVRKDGQKFPGEVASVVFQDHAGIDRTSMIIRDVTTRKQTEESLRRQTHEAEILHQAAASLTSSLDLNQVLDSLFQQLAQVVAYDSFAVFLLQEQQLLAIAGRGLSFPEKVIGQKFPVRNELFDAVRETGQPVIIKNVQESLQSENWGQEDHPHDWIGVPLIVNGELIGLLTIDKLKVGDYDETQAKLAIAFANQAAIAIQNARLYEQAQREITDRIQAENRLRQRSDELSALNILGQEVTSSISSGNTTTVALSKVMDLIQPDQAYLFLQENDKLVLKDALTQNHEASTMSSLDHLLGECICRHAANENKPIYARNISEDRSDIWEECRQAGLKSIAALPLRSGKEVIGVLGLASKSERDFEHQADFHETLSSQISAALENARLLETIKGHAVELEQRVDLRTQELREAQEQLARQEKLATLGQLAGGVGQELRNPLSIINNAIYFLRMIQPDADDKVKEYLRIIDAETQTADKIINDLLDFSRIQSVDLEPVTVHDLILRVLERYPNPENVTVKYDLAEKIPTVCVDPRQITQALGNLVLNAYQAIDAKDSTNQDELSISAVETVIEGQSYIAVSFKDTGIGIPPENMARLFEPLFTTKPRGIGLGLAVGRKLVEANHGRIEVHSEVDQGSTFTVFLPVMCLSS